MGLGADNVIVGGSEADKFVDELQKSVGDQMTITRDPKSGELSYTSNGKLSKKGKKLAAAIDDKSITVDIQANDTEVTRDGDNFFGGAFLGNTVSTSKNGETTVLAIQDVNPVVLGKADDFSGKKGSSSLHELTEAYEGAKYSKKTGISAGKAGSNDGIYNIADRRATKQRTSISFYTLDFNKQPIDDIPANRPLIGYRRYTAQKYGGFSGIKLKDVRWVY